LREFQAKFATEDGCQQYLAACRWPDGFVCPRCGNQRAYALLKLKRWQCIGCRHQVSLTAGTILHNTKTPLTVWFWAAYLMTTDKRGISALLLQRQLALERYETAWMMLHKFRRAMINLAREPLRGEVEVDETWVGRMAVIRDFKSATLITFLKQNVEAGSTVYTDGLKSLTGLPKAGFQHVPRSQPLRIDLRQGAKSAVPLADRAIGNLQQWLIGTYHGVSRDQLQVYLDEFVFRHNRRRQPMAAFQTLLGLGTGRKPTTYKQIRGAVDLSTRPTTPDPKVSRVAETTG
jgi:transposase-like protein